ncbi:aminotransferase [Geomesophilobacter sediminis]|uniref:Aminotransferase n=1 Tax=Geomesophilobacter sediminis TaxID=2798584 RepID=A0A8J7SBU8_9BACT|nr:aminotransferase [Geomesophilobacter sediminis]MBJ6726584.1 aminotransferase [Geomesophilobacter sediminis]
MQYPISDLVRGVHSPPISEVKGWLAAARLQIPVIDLCQAIPDYPPARELTDHLATLLDDPLLSRYSPDEGLLEVREAICTGYQRSYGGRLRPSEICLTIGASQAFWLALVTLCRAGDEIIVQLPAYFDHPMALTSLGVRPIYAPFDEHSAGLPNVKTLEGLITDRTRAILLVSPSNPTGAVIPPALVRELYELAARRKIALILDETYNAFITGGVRPHDLFEDDDWGEHFIHIASFGKTYALTGYRAGMLVAAPEFISNALKVQDTMAVCQPRITQHAVRYGMEHLDEWVAANRVTMERRHELFRSEFAKPGNAFRLVASGPFFGWVRHPFDGCSGREVAKRLVQEAGLLLLPGEVFGPGLERYLRLAFGNISEEAIPEAVRRFREFPVGPAGPGQIGDQRGDVVLTL